MRVIIAGSREIIWYEFVCQAIRESGFEITEVVSGTARGVDQLGERWAREHGVPIIRFPADWERFGKKAGFLRNVDMGDYGDALIACWNGTSHGTASMIDIMNRLGKKLYIKKPNKWSKYV